MDRRGVVEEGTKTPQGQRAEDGEEYIEPRFLPEIKKL
jgi:hypothetical protein